MKPHNFEKQPRSIGLSWCRLKMTTPHSRSGDGDNGNYLGCRGAMRDLTLHKELENEKERLVAAVEQFSDSMAITNLDGKLDGKLNGARMEPQTLRDPIQA